MKIDAKEALIRKLAELPPEERDGFLVGIMFEVMPEEVVRPVIDHLASTVIALCDGTLKKEDVPSNYNDLMLTIFRVAGRKSFLDQFAKQSNGVH